MTATATDLIAAVLRSAHFTIAGRVGQAPELQWFTSGNCKVRLSIAVNRPGAKRNDPNAPPPDWFKVEAWGTIAEEITNGLQKGDMVRVTGRIKSDRWTDRQGQERTDLVVTAEEWSKVDTEQRPAAAGGAPAAAGLPAQAAGGWSPTDEEIPF